MHRTPFRAVRQKFANDLEDILECPICLGQYKGIIMLCLSGHGICQECYQQLREKICPLCKDKYYGTRNYLAQNLAKKFDEIKISLTDPDNSINRIIVKDKMCVGTQTSPLTINRKEIQDRDDDDDSSLIANHSNQPTYERPLTRLRLKGMINPKENTVPKQMEDSNEVIQSTANRTITVKPGSGKFPCLIGICSERLSHGLMVSHLREHHAKFFSDAGIVEGSEYTKKWKIQYKPNSSFDQAIYIENMGLFFVKIVISEEGDVHGCPVQLNNVVEKAKHFTYSLSIGKNDIHISFENKVLASRVASKSSLDLFIPRTHVKDIMKKGKSLDCVLKITHRSKTLID